MVVARHLALAAVPVSLVFLGSRSGAAPMGDAGIQYEIVRALGLESRVVGREDSVPLLAFGGGRPRLVVDGLFGTGLDRPLSGSAAALVEAINAAESPVLALDLPSGLDADTGRALGPCVRATATATFVAPKLGFSAPGAAEWTGVVHLVGIGAPLDWPPPHQPG